MKQHQQYRKQHSEQKKVKMKYHSPSLQVVELEQIDTLSTSTYTTRSAKKFQTTFVMSPWEQLTADDDGKITSID